jgi:hypothetical protein
MQYLKLLATALALVVGPFALVGARDAVVDWGAGRFWHVAEAETFLLPDGYEGPVTLAFAEPRGDTLRREGAARLYDFRARAVLVTSARFPEGRREPDFYYVDARGRRRLLARGARCSEEGPTPQGLFICPDYHRPDAGPWTVYADVWVVTRRLADVPALRRLGEERASATRDEAAGDRS